VSIFTLLIKQERETEVEQSPVASFRLLPALPKGEFVNRPVEIDRFIVRLWPDGSLYFKGSRERIDEFLLLCREMELNVQVDYLSLCG
jgi:hypothetical protein